MFIGRSDQYFSKIVTELLGQWFFRFILLSTAWVLIFIQMETLGIIIIHKDWNKVFALNAGQHKLKLDNLI